MRNDFESNYLAHHGVPDQKWGVRNGPPYPLEKSAKSKEEQKFDNMVFKNLKNSKTANLEKWGKTKDTNILYVTGLSGSGKSTTASYIADDGKTDAIHLDMYFNQMSQESRDAYQNKAFNSYLDKHVKDWRKIPDMLEKDKSAKTKAWKTVDEFAAASEKFGQQQFAKKRKVVMEGVELLGETMYTDINKYKGKPVIIVQTNNLQSAIRGSIRDGVDPITTIQRMLGKQAASWTRELKDLENTVEAQRGSEWIDNYIKTHK